MPPVVTLAVLAAAVLHATWNAMAHRIKDQLAAFGLIGVGSVAVAAPLVAVVAVPRAACWPYLLASVAIHVFYNLLLMRAFSNGDFGQVYPLARGTSPMVVTGLAAVFAAERPTAGQLAGVLVISAGLGTLVLAGRRTSPPSRTAPLGLLTPWPGLEQPLRPEEAIRQHRLPIILRNEKTVRDSGRQASGPRGPGGRTRRRSRRRSMAW